MGHDLPCCGGMDLVRSLDSVSVAPAAIPYRQTERTLCLTPNAPRPAPSLYPSPSESPEVGLTFGPSIRWSYN